MRDTIDLPPAKLRRPRHTLHQEITFPSVSGQLPMISGYLEGGSTPASFSRDCHLSKMHRPGRIPAARLAPAVFSSAREALWAPATAWSHAASKEGHATMIDKFLLIRAACSLLLGVLALPGAAFADEPYRVSGPFLHANPSAGEKDKE